MSERKQKSSRNRKTAPARKQKAMEKPFDIEDYTLKWENPQDHFSLMMNGYIPKIYPKPFR